MSQSTSNKTQNVGIYAAHPLALGQSKSIRLLSFARVQTAADWLAPIMVNIDTFFLDVAPPFTALLYVWGSSSLSESIVIDGHPFAVRTNLKVFSSRARTVEQGYLCVDALCIDQS